MLARTRSGSLWSVSVARPESTRTELLLPQTLEQLHEQERVAAGLARHADQRLIGLSLHNVPRHLRHRGVAERLEREPFCTLVGEILDGAPKLPRALIRAHRQNPSDRQRAQTRRQRAQRSHGAAVDPLHVVQEYEQWTVQCGALEQRLQILQPPVALLGRRVKPAQPGAIQQRFRSLEQRPEQRRELGHGLRRLSRADPNRKAHALRHPHALADQPALAHTSRPLDQQNHTRTRAHPID